MSERRLSRLQKWILGALYVVGTEYPISTAGLIDASICRMAGEWAKVNDLPSPWGKQRPKRASITVSISRAMAGLVLKGFLFEYGGKSNPTPDRFRVISDKRGNIKSVTLTEEGEAKARGLLNVKNQKLNVKKSEN